MPLHRRLWCENGAGAGFSITCSFRLIPSITRARTQAIRELASISLAEINSIDAAIEAKIKLTLSSFEKGHGSTDTPFLFSRKRRDGSGRPGSCR